MSITRKLICILICAALMAGMLPAALAEEDSVIAYTFGEFKEYAESGNYSAIRLYDGNYEATADVTVTQNLEIDLKGCPLDMGKHTITVTSGTLTIKDTSSGTAGKILGSVSDPALNHSLIKLTGSGSLVLISGSILGKKESTDTSYTTGIEQDGSGSILIKGGAVTGYYYAILHNGSGSVTVTGGSVEGNGSAIVHYGTPGIVSIQGGTVKTNNSTAAAIQTAFASVDVSGGYINGKLQLTAGSELKGGFYTVEPPEDYIPEGYKREVQQGEETYKYKIICTGTVLTADPSNPKTAKAGESFQLKVALTDLNGDALSGKTVTYGSITGTTDSDGIATLTFPGEEEGNYSYTVTFAGDAPYESTTCKLNITVTDRYTITSGADSSYTKGSGKTLEFTCDGDDSMFSELAVDGSAVDKANMDVRHGSTVVTLKNSYLESLNNGSHTIRFKYSDGKFSNTVNFTVNPKAEPTPETGDETPVMIFGALALISILGIAILEKRTRNGN